MVTKIQTALSFFASGLAPTLDLWITEVLVGASLLAKVPAASAKIVK